MKKVLKVLLIIVLIIALLIGGFMFLLAGSYSRVKRDINSYSTDVEKVCNAAKLMPDLESLGSYTDIEYRYKIKCYSTLVGFYSDGLALFVTYDKDQYETFKNQAISNYTFLQAPVYDSRGYYELPVTEFNYKGYTMKVVPDEEYIGFCACKSFMLLGFNDEANTIAFLYYHDIDIDYIAEAGENLEEEMCKLVDSAFSWAG